MENDQFDIITSTEKGTVFIYVTRCFIEVYALIGVTIENIHQIKNTKQKYK